MSTSLSKTNTSRLPATPSRRDLQIYKGYVILQQDQLSIAAHFDIGRTRISQIVAKVKRWLAAGGSPTDPQIRDHLAQQRLSEASQRIRLLRIIDKATYAAEARLPSQKIIKSRYHGTSEVWRDETSILAPEVNLPALRLLLRAVKDFGEFEKTHGHSAQEKPSQPLSENQLLFTAFELLCRWRAQAEAAGHFPASADIRQLVFENLHALLGPLASRLTTTDTRLPSAHIGDEVSAIEHALIAPTTDQPTTSIDDANISQQKNSPQC
jgi:hypothetical protein